jgi:hypothetical protein
MALTLQARRVNGDLDRILKVTLSDKLEKADFEAFIPMVEERIRRHGKVRLLVALVDFRGWTAGAIWEDTKFGLRHFNHVERLAIVGDRKWQEGMALLTKAFTTATVRYFDQADEDEATRWIEEDAAEAGPEAEDPPHMTASAPEGLDTKLEALESAARVPSLPGEMGPWADALERPFEAVREAVAEMSSVNQRHYKQIRSTDPALLPRVQELKTKEDDLKRELDSMFSTLHDLGEADVRDPGTGQEPSWPMARLREEMLAWIALYRAHMTEVRTWLSEAFYRDRGVVD